MIGVMLMQNGNVIKKTWIILYNFSTDIVTNSLDYVEYGNNCAKVEDITVLTN